MRSHGEAGFTLLEMLVALTVLSFAVLALVNLAGENLRTESAIEARTFAQVVAENRAVEALTSLQPPALGETSGTEDAANRHWQWTRKVGPTAQADILRVDIAVKIDGGDQVLSEVTIFRGRQ
jgi:general secretion pathway protein I